WTAPLIVVRFNRNHPMALRCRRVGAVHSIIFDRWRRSRLPVQVRFAPRATELSHFMETTLSANDQSAAVTAAQAVCESFLDTSIWRAFRPHSGSAWRRGGLIDRHCPKI